MTFTGVLWMYIHSMIHVTKSTVQFCWTSFVHADSFSQMCVAFMIACLLLILYEYRPGWKLAIYLTGYSMAAMALSMAIGATATALNIPTQNYYWTLH